MEQDPAFEFETEERAACASFSSAERNKLRILFAAHVILGLFFSFWLATEDRQPSELLHVTVAVWGFALAQAALLGFWAAFSLARWWVRLVGVIIGSVYLGFLLFFLGGPDGFDFHFLVTLTTVRIAGVFFVIRWRYADLYRLTQQTRQANNAGLKVSIRGLMIFTLVVAVSIIGIRGMREHSSSDTHLLLVAAWSLCFVVIGLAGVWAALGLGRPLTRSLVVLLVSAILGIVFITAFGYVKGVPATFEQYIFVVSIMVLDAVLVVLSLLIVRFCGYRVRARSKPP